MLRGRHCTTKSSFVEGESRKLLRADTGQEGGFSPHVTSIKLLPVEAPPYGRGQSRQHPHTGPPKIIRCDAHYWRAQVCRVYTRCGNPCAPPYMARLLLIALALLARASLPSLYPVR
jgi:hypothetical protein